MDLGSLLFLLLVLACPLAMLWMMRGGHGAHSHGAHGAGHSHAHGSEPGPVVGPLDELQRLRTELDAVIARLEEADAGKNAADTERTTADTDVKTPAAT